MNENLMKAVLALDVYNRFDLPGMAVPGIQLGNYTLLESNFFRCGWLSIDRWLNRHQLSRDG